MTKETWTAKLKRELAEAKAELKELKDKVIVNTDDNIYSSAENNTVKVYKIVAFAGPVAGFLLGLLF